MASQWYYSGTGQLEGPVDRKTLRQLAVTGELRPEDYVCKVPEWKRARQIKTLVFRKELTPPPVPTPTAPDSAGVFAPSKVKAMGTGEMPVVSQELIASIGAQHRRSMECDDSIEDMYFMQTMNEIEAENPHLAEAIFSTARTFAEAFTLDPNDNKDHAMVANLVHIAAAVYQSIKQQMICNELATVDN